jgi:hypothetical protein
MIQDLRSLFQRQCIIALVSEYKRAYEVIFFTIKAQASRKERFLVIVITNVDIFTIGILTLFVKIALLFYKILKLFERADCRP